MKPPATRKPCPLFDSLKYERRNKYPIIPAHLPTIHHKDYLIARQFLLSYQNNEQTYNAYRREVERLLQWCYCREKKPLQQITRVALTTYLKFCQKPLKSWIGQKNALRFIEKNQQRLPNPQWRPFMMKLNKADFQKHKPCKAENYQLSKKSFREILTVLSSFFVSVLPRTFFTIFKKLSFYSQPST